MRANGEQPQPCQVGLFLYRGRAALVSSWMQQPVQPFLRALALHSLLLPLPVLTVHHFHSWQRSSSLRARNITAVVIAE